jgi:hypothetical protein
MFTECSLNVHWMFTNVHCATRVRVHGPYRRVLQGDVWDDHLLAIITECSLNVHWMFTKCLLNVHWIFTECSLYDTCTGARFRTASSAGWRLRWPPACNNHWMFTEYSLNVHCTTRVRVHGSERRVLQGDVWDDHLLAIITECSLNVYWIITENSLKRSPACCT